MDALQTQTPRTSPRLRLPTEEERKQAGELIRQLSPAPAEVGDSSTVRLSIRGADGTESEPEIPPLALALLGRILEEMAKGNALMVIPVHAQLTTQEAADLLGVSRPYLTKLVDNGELPCQMVGTHRWIGFEDLMDYKKRTYEARGKVLDELVARSQELGTGY